MALCGPLCRCVESVVASVVRFVAVLDHEWSVESCHFRCESRAAHAAEHFVEVLVRLRRLIEWVLAAVEEDVSVQLADVIRTCRACASISEAGRTLFNVSRGKRQALNDANRLRKHLARFGLSWQRVRV